jgi:ribosome-associated toxin RatA of RatAB toxin-antitoxin module
VKHINKTALVPYNCSEMFDLVNNVNDYPIFLPWCKSVTLVSQTESEIVATIHMGGAGLEKSFTTKNIITPNKTIQMSLVNGPFDHLSGAWNFSQLGDEGCKISLNLEFEIKNRLLNMSLGPVFTKICSRLLDGFINRANKVYGSGK